MQEISLLSSQADSAGNTAGLEAQLELEVDAVAQNLANSEQAIVNLRQKVQDIKSQLVTIERGRQAREFTIQRRTSELELEAAEDISDQEWEFAGEMSKIVADAQEFKDYLADSLKQLSEDEIRDKLRELDAKSES